VTGVGNNYCIALVSREDQEIGGGSSQSLKGVPLSSWQVVLRLIADLQDPESLLSDLLSCFF
jgi:hypothetical protein